MRAAAVAFGGMQDFRAFAETDANDDEGSSKVLVERLEVVEAHDLVLVGIEGSHFLWKMVRRIVGVLAEIGRGRLDVAAAGTLLRGDSGLPAKLTAPPSGLFLEKVYYEGDARGAPFTKARII
jgi:tRNA pseudouridine38-40 synthase